MSNDKSGSQQSSNESGKVIGDQISQMGEQQYEVDPSNPIFRVSAEYKGTRTHEYILNNVCKQMIQVSSVNEIHERLKETLSKLSRLGVYKQLNLQIEPGQSVNDMHLKFNFIEKSLFFGSFSQYIDRNGTASTSFITGLRNILGLCETIKFETSKSFDYQKKAQVSLDVQIPQIYQNFLLNTGYSLTDRNIDDNVQEVTDSTFLRIQNSFTHSKYGNKQYYIQFNNAIRTNSLSVYSNSSQYVLDTQFIPSTKKSMKFGVTFQDTVQYNQETKSERGQQIESSIEFPFFKSDFNSIKLDFLYKQFIQVPFNNSINLENNFYTGILFPLTKHTKVQINDRFYFYNLRGFSSVGYRIPSHVYTQQQQQVPGMAGDHIGSDLIIRNTLKLNLCRYPLLHKINSQVFFHATWAFVPGPIFSFNTNDLLLNKIYPKNHNFYSLFKNESKLSTGLGMALNLGGGKLEILYNFAHYCQPYDKMANFQIRLALND